MTGAARRVGAFDHPAFVEHQTGPLHVERPARVLALRETLSPLALVARQAEPASRAMIERIHRPELVDLVASTAGQGGLRHLDADTVVSGGSYTAALAAAGAAVHAAREVGSGALDSAFVMARPPGHHAETDHAMGFCLFNNVAVAAADALERAMRVAIVDWDVHHGNGTQWIFYGEPRVLYVSLHRYPFYPGTGAASELGSAAGKGANLNVPLPAGATDALYLAAFERVVLPKLRAFAPGLILVSAGYDAHVDDPLGGMQLSADAFRWMTRQLLELCTAQGIPGPVLVLEGGYSLKGLAASALACVDELIEASTLEPARGTLSPAEAKLLDDLRRLHHLP